MGIPRLRPTANPQAAPAAAQGVTRGLVLVVDDAPLNLELARWVLQPQGYQVVPARSAADALAAARRERPDLILSDLHMPDRDGFALLADLQADAQLRDVPFAFLTAETLDIGDLDRALARGAKAFLQRPLGVEELLAEVERLIGNGRRDRAEP